MNSLENHGIIIRELRKMMGLNVREAAQKINKSIGWLSEIENGCGTARLSQAEFDRIVDCLNGTKHRSMFRTWVANYKNQERTDKTFDGAVLKFIRKKRNLSLENAAILIGVSATQLCRLETGAKPMELQMRYKIMKAYGYNPTSFKNLATDPIRSQAVPKSFKFKILSRILSNEQLDEIYQKALSQKNLGGQNV